MQIVETGMSCLWEEWELILYQYSELALHARVKVYSDWEEEPASEDQEWSVIQWIQSPGRGWSHSGPIVNILNPSPLPSPATTYKPIKIQGHLNTRKSI